MCVDDFYNVSAVYVGKAGARVRTRAGGDLSDPVLIGELFALGTLHTRYPRLAQTTLECTPGGPKSSLSHVHYWYVIEVNETYMAASAGNCPEISDFPVFVGLFNHWCP